MVYSSVWDNMRNTVCAASVALVLVCTVLYALGVAVHTYWLLLLTWFVVVSAANVFHMWCHSRPCERPIIADYLMRWGVLVSHEKHAHHHRHPNTDNYGVILAPTNALYEWLGLWTGLTRAMCWMCPSVQTDTTLDTLPLKTPGGHRACPKPLTLDDRARYQRQMRAYLVFQEKKMPAYA